MVAGRPESGYIALIAVLVVGAAALAVSLALLTTAADTQRTTLIEQQAVQSRSIARACAEEALQQIHDNTAFTGSNLFTVGQGSCLYSVTNTGGANRSIFSTAIVSGASRKIQVSAIIGSSSISVTSWQEIP